MVAYIDAALGSQLWLERFVDETSTAERSLPLREACDLTRRLG